MAARWIKLALILLGGLSASSAAAQSYRIQPGDVLQIEVIEDPGLNRSVLVSPDGRITLPLAGPVQAGGRTIEQVQADVTSLLAPNFAAPPNVFVGIASLAPEEPPGPPPVPREPVTIDIFFVGEATNPGRLELEPGTTFLQAIAEMGGFTRFAATDRVQLRRTNPDSGQEVVYQFSYDAIEDGRSNAGTVTLADGDVIVVPQRGLFE